MSESQKLIKQSGHYFSGQMLIMLSSFISFPVLTRVLSVSDYGILSLVSTTLALAVALSKLGLPNSVIRFYEEWKAAYGSNGTARFCSTLLLGTLATALLVTFLLWAGAILGSLQEDSDRYLLSLLCVSSLLIPCRCIESILLSFLRAEQQSRSCALFGILRRYGGLSMSLFFLVFILRSLYGFYIGLIASEVFVVLLLLKRARGRSSITFASFSMGIFKDVLRYGAPLIAYEFGGLLLSLGDRFVIKHFLGNESVGLYSAAYNLPMYISEAVVCSIGFALTPIYVSIWVNRGAEQTRRFLSSGMKYFVMLAVPMCFGILAISRELLAVLASAKYRAASHVIPYVLVGSLVYGSRHFLIAGLYLHKKTYLMTILLVGIGIANVILNVFLIPLMGIIGAALATLFSYVLLTLLITVFSFKCLRFTLPAATMMRATACSILMFFAVRSISMDNVTMTLIVRVALGVVAYGILLLACEPAARQHLRHLSNRPLPPKHRS